MAVPLVPILLLVAAIVAPRAPEGGTTVVRIEGELGVGDLALMRRAIDGARGRKDRLLIELDTPGGEVQLMWKLARMIDQADGDGVKTAAWIDDRALSAGALLALACSDIYMRDGAILGASQAVTFGPGGIQGIPADEVVEEKHDATLRSSFRSWAEAHGRPPALAEAMVDRDVWVRRVRVEGEERIVSDKEWDDLRLTAEPQLVETICSRGELLALTQGEAVRYGMASGGADSLAAVVTRLGGDPDRITRVERARSDELASLLYRLGPLLLVLGLILGYAELKAPGFGIPGLLSIACFAVMLFGRYLVGLADIPQIVVIALGAALLVVELFLVPGTIWVGLIGCVAVLGGLAWSFVDSGGGLEHELDRVLALDAAFDVVLVAFVTALGIWVLSRVLPSTPALGWLVLRPRDPRPSFAGAMGEAEGEHGRLARVGAGGRALTALRPVGKVALDGDPALEFEARSSGPEIGPGSRVRVVEVRSGRLVVELEGEVEAGG